MVVLKVSWCCIDRAVAHLHGVGRRHYMTQPLAELYAGCMVVLKVSWCCIDRAMAHLHEVDRRADRREAGVEHALVCPAGPETAVFSV